MNRSVKLTLLLLLIPLLTIAQGYWAFQDLQQEVSSGCLHCNLLLELLPIGCLLILPVLGLRWIITFTGPPGWFTLSAQLMLLIVCWLFLDLSIYSDRVAAWSSFSKAAAWRGSVAASWVAILSCGLVWAIAAQIIDTKKKI